MANSKTALDQQQELAQLYGTNGSIIWDLYEANDIELLNYKLKFLFPSFPSNLQDYISGLGDRQEALKKYEEAVKQNKNIEHGRKSLAETIWNQRKYCEGKLLMSIIFVLYTPEIIEPLSYAKYTKNYNLYPIFRVKKCKKSYTNENCCSIFVDPLGRVYQNWVDFIQNNKLPSGIIIAPKRGVYKFDENDLVILEYLPTPSSSIGEKILKATDYSTAILGVGSVLPIIAAPLAPIAVPVLIGCSIIGGMCGAWSIGRSSAQLADRGYHEQTINLHDREARSCWLNIAGGAIGIGAMGMSTALSTLAASERAIPQAFSRAVIGVKTISAVTNGIGFGNNIVDIIMKYHNDEYISSMDIIQISASFVLFTHSLNNIRMVKNFSNENQISTNRFIKSVVEQQRKNISKMVSHASNFINYVGNFDIYRPSNKIPNNKHCEDLISIMQKINEDNSLALQPNGQSTNDTEIIPSDSIQMSSSSAVLIIKAINHLSKIFFVTDINSLADALLNMAEIVCVEVFNKLIDMAEEFAKDIGKHLEIKFKVILPFDDFIWKMFTYIRSSGSDNIKITFTTLMSNKTRIFNFLKDFYNKLFAPAPGRKELKCTTCGGCYTITNL